MEENTRAQWRLEDIFASDEAWEAACTEADKDFSVLAGFEGTLGRQDMLLKALETFFALTRKAESLLVYAHMKRDEDMRIPLYQGMLSRAQALQARADAAGAFIAPELLSLPQAYLDQVQKAPEFEIYRVFLQDVCRQRPHTLSQGEEKLLAMAAEVGAGPESIYEMLTDADMIFPQVKDEQGQMVQLTQASYVPLLMSAQRPVRQGAFEAYYKTLGQYQSTIPAAYAASVKYDLFLARARNFADARQMNLFGSHIPEKVYDTLISQVIKYLPALNRYLETNARRLGLEKLARWDMYAPAATQFELALPFQEALALVADCLAPLGEDYQQLVAHSHKAGWVDPFERPGKHSGAYSWGTYDSHPYVLMNYHENVESLLTLAHELGHSMHTYFSNQVQPYPISFYSLFVAEVASTVNEVLVLLELLRRYPQPDQQAYLLNTLLEGYNGTLFRQTLFANFEHQAHRMAQEGQALTAQSLNQLYGQLTDQWYPGVEPCPQIRMEWMRIPHFYSAYYVYVYATGFAAATAIAKDLFEGRPGAREGYRAFLSAGSSLPPIEALKLAGVDMEDAQPVEKALALFEEMVERYQALAH